MCPKGLQGYDPSQVREVRRVTGAGIVANLFLSALKFVCGIVGSSQAIVADAVHSLSDTTTDAAILVGVSYWSAPADEGHPHGHRRVETFVTLLIGALLAGVAAALIYNAVTTLGEEHARPLGWIAFGAALVSIVSKEILYRWTVAVGKRIKSSAVMANAWHHRSDSLSSIPAALAVLGAKIHPAWAFLDHMGAVVVSIFIFQAAWQIARPALGELVDAGAPEQDRERIRAIAMETDGVRQVHAIRTRYVGSGLQVDLHVLVDSAITVRRGHEISGAVKHGLLAEGPDVVDVVVHVEPFEDEV